jgi:hypothetical protein
MPGFHADTTIHHRFDWIVTGSDITANTNFTLAEFHTE